MTAHWVKNSMVPTLTNLTKLIGENGGNFVSGAHVSIADCAWLPFLRTMVKMNPKALENHPRID